MNIRRGLLLLEFLFDIENEKVVSLFKDVREDAVVVEHPVAGIG